MRRPSSLERRPQQQPATPPCEPAVRASLCDPPALCFVCGPLAADAAVLARAKEQTSVQRARRAASHDEPENAAAVAARECGE